MLSMDREDRELRLKALRERRDQAARRTEETAERRQAISDRSVRSTDPERAARRRDEAAVHLDNAQDWNRAALLSAIAAYERAAVLLEKMAADEPSMREAHLASAAHFRSFAQRDRQTYANYSDPDRCHCD